jgi:hypothetical protein
MEKTTVQLSKKTLERLRACKQHPRESYDDIMNRLISQHKEQAHDAGTAQALLRFAGMITEERAQEWETSIRESRERSRRRYR